MITVTGLARDTDVQEVQGAGFDAVLSKPCDRSTLFRIDALQRIRGEYLEMPGLTLTIAQAARLWGLDSDLCRDLLDRLVTDGFLKCRHDSYSRS